LNDLRQLEYYREIDMFENKEDIELIYDKFKEMVSHMELQALRGKN
jgi:hypothetical protein